MFSGVCEECRPQQSRVKELREAVAAAPECEARTSKLTFYNSDPGSYRTVSEVRLEGGAQTRYGEPIHSIEQSIASGRPVTLASDIYGSFGEACNRRGRRCTILITARGFDRLFPAYRKKFPHLPADSFVGIVEDTGRAFYHKGSSKFDLATRNRGLANGRIPAYLSTRVTWRKLNNPCGRERSSRECDLSNLRLSRRCI